MFTLVECGGSARSLHVDSTSIAEIIPIVLKNVAPVYRGLGRENLSHDAVNHGKKEYVRCSADDVITTNTVEGYYSIFKRGMKGLYQHCSEEHFASLSC